MSLGRWGQRCIWRRVQGGIRNEQGRVVTVVNPARNVHVRRGCSHDHRLTAVTAPRLSSRCLIYPGAAQLRSHNMLPFPKALSLP